MRTFLAALGLVGVFAGGASFVASCQAAKTALDVAKDVCQVVDYVDRDGGTVTAVNIADDVCQYVEVAYYDPISRQTTVQLVPKAQVEKAALYARAAGVPERPASSGK